ncbi:MAG: hypothetical protein DSY37_04105 [Hyperthermus sp.]|nr:MAG: hypothetical protein DSY37_04105 [Hyperthermus sp.]
MVAGTAILLLTMLAALTIFYFWASNTVSETSISAERIVKEVGNGVVKVDAVYLGPDYMLAYVRAERGTYRIDRVYVYDEIGRLIASAKIEPPVTVSPNRVTIVSMDLGKTRLRDRIRGVGLVRLVFATGRGMKLYSPLVFASRMPASTKVGIIVGRYFLWTARDCPSISLTLDPTQIHWIYMDLVTGSYHFYTINNNNITEKSGRGTVIKDTNVLELNEMTTEEISRLGPLIIFINPTRGSEDYYVTIVDVNGNKHRFILAKLVNQTSQVTLDALACFEDMWAINSMGHRHGFDYADHVVRVTLFSNGTIRLEVLWASGYYLHMLMYNPKGLPSPLQVPSLVSKYMTSNCTLERSDGVVYVKAHLAWLPYRGSEFRRFIWDPVNASWLDPRHTIVLTIPQ